MAKVYHEAARDIPVYAECDILVIGAGAAGQAAAVSERSIFNAFQVVRERNIRKTRAVLECIERDLGHSRRDRDACEAAAAVERADEDLGHS